MSLPVFPGPTPAFAPAIGAVPATLPPGARVLAFDGAFVVVRDAPAALPDEALPITTPHLIGTLDGALVVAGALQGEVPEGHRAMDLRGLASALPAAHWAAAAYAAQVLHWDRTNRFCGACGRPTVPAADPAKRAKVCEGCGHEVYPRVSPCTITAIHDGALTARSELSGVNFDAEAIDLVRFQQAYQASSRVVQVARETFQSILEIR